MALEGYQQHALDWFFHAGPRRDGVVLELGSDIGAKVCLAIAAKTQGRVIGMNPHPDFPRLAGGATVPERVELLREDGRKIPLGDATVDAVFTVATVEHVIGLDSFYAEIHRVLKPGGLLHADFAPIWSCNFGHHVAVILGSKEARFWKPGRNPIPDFAHLLWSPDEMREFLRGGPCSLELIEPIIDWVYFGDGINRCFMEDHLAALERSGLWCERLRRKPAPHPDAVLSRRLKEKYGAGRDFTASGLEATMRKPGGGFSKSGTSVRRWINRSRELAMISARAMTPALRQFRFFRDLLDRRHLP